MGIPISESGYEIDFFSPSGVPGTVVTDDNTPLALYPSFNGCEELSAHIWMVYAVVDAGPICLLSTNMYT